jgi:FkbM family methyltransferase
MFTVAAAARYPKGRIYTFEPDPQNVRFLKENIEKNEVEGNITVIPFAVLDGQDITLYANPHNSAENNMYKIKRGMTSINVGSVSLAKYIYDNNITSIDFLKIDCEGAEYSILSKLPPESFSIIKKMAIEWHGYAGYTVPDLIDCLNRNGFQTKFIERPRMIYASR